MSWYVLAEFEDETTAVSAAVSLKLKHPDQLVYTLSGSAEPVYLTSNEGHRAW